MAFIKKLIIPFTMILIAASGRILPHPPNFTPVMGVALFAGFSLSGGLFTAILAPITAMLITDFFIGFHSLLIVVYLLIAIMVVAGRILKKSGFQTGKIALFSFAGALLFFLVTNFAVWLTSGMYSLDLQGLMSSYIMAIPFFGNALAGDLFYTSVLFGSWHILTRTGIVETVPVKTGQQ